MASYIALLHKDKESDYGVSFPDFPGCVTAGTTLEEARRFAAEALELHIVGMQEDGELIPEPSTLDAVVEDPDYGKDAVVFLVDAKVERSKAVRVNVTFKENVLSQIDSFVASSGTTRAAFLESVAIDRLNQGSVRSSGRGSMHRRGRESGRENAGRKKAATRKKAAARVPSLLPPLGCRAVL